MSLFISSNFFRLLSFLIILIRAAHLFPPVQSSSSSTFCRCIASDDNCWPDLQTWNSFNSSIDGRLISVLPPAAPCHAPHFDAQACQIAKANWGNPFWRADQPGAMQASNWEMSANHTCLITSASSSSSPCSQGAVPTYAVNVSSPSQVQSAVSFASAHRLRLVIKNTGHSYLGQSSASGSLSIWLHNMKNVTFHEKFVPEGCPAGADDIDQSSSPAVTVGAGVQWEELYSETFKRNSVVVGGGCSSVGAAGGYAQAGGHSPISPLHGLAADNVLQYQVVTSDGKLLVANRCQNAELFWALRGGGGGTFGVAVSATHKTHPSLSSLIFAFYNFTAVDRPEFHNLLTQFLRLNPALSDAGWSGYFRLAKNNMILTYLLPNGNVTSADESLAPLMTYVRQQRPEGVQVSGRLLTFSSFQEWRLQVLCEGKPDCYTTSGEKSTGTLIGVPVAVASRLIPRKTIEDHPSQLAEALVSIGESYRVTGSLVAGGKVSVPQENAVNFAWRQSLLFLILGTGWKESATNAEQYAIRAGLTETNRLLREMTPGSGTYMNEADFNEPEWQQSFFGDNYPRLYGIKQKVDPDGLFVCRHCVGSEDWSEDLNCRRTSPKP